MYIRKVIQRSPGQGNTQFLIENHNENEWQQQKSIANRNKLMQVEIGMAVHEVCPRNVRELGGGGGSAFPYLHSNGKTEH